MIEEVYEPAEDSELIKKHIQDVAKGLVLDMGTGSGILAEEAAKFASKVIAVDINKNALKVSTERIEFRYSDLFEKVPEKFDCIICNPPYLPQDEGIVDTSLYGGKIGNEYILRFLDEAKNHLNPEGTILLLFSSFSKPKEIIAKMKASYQYELLDMDHISFEDLFVYKLWLKE